MRLLSPRDVADALGVSESSLKRWVDAGRLRATRTEGGHRRIELAEVLRFVRTSRIPVARPELLDLPEVAQARTHGDRLYDTLADGDAAAAQGWLKARYLEGATVADLADGPIRAAMHALGELWRHDPQGVFVEHRATVACLQAVAQLRALIPDPPAGAPVALGGAPAGDPYLLPTQLASLVLEEAGVRAVNLGPETPVSAFAQAIAQHRPQLVWISVTTAVAPGRARAYARWLAALPHTVTVIVGGQQAVTLAPLPPRVRRGAGMAELVDVARVLTRGRAPRANGARAPRRRT